MIQTVIKKLIFGHEFESSGSRRLSYHEIERNESND